MESLNVHDTPRSAVSALDPGPMSASPSIGNLDVANFTVGAMLRAGIAVRKGLRGAESLEEAANMLVRFLYDNCVDAVTGDSTTSCSGTALHPWSGLEGCCGPASCSR